LDDSTALSLRQVTGTEVSFVIDAAGAGGNPGTGGAGEAGGPRVVGTTLDPTEAEALAAWLATSPADDGEARELDLGGSRNLATVRPIYDVAGEKVGRVVNLGSLEQALAPFERIGHNLLIVGLVTVLLALVATFLLGRRLLEPVRQLAGAAQKAARGDFEVEIEVPGHKDEVSQLAEAFAGLLSELREKRDMQVYLTELTRTLPEQESVKAEAVPATAVEVTFLGVELRGYAREAAAGTLPRQTLEQLGQTLRRLSRAIQGRGGRIEAVMGHRLLAVFEGDRHPILALSAAAEVASLERRAVLALTSGSVVAGTVTWHNRPAMAFTGRAVDQLDDLLRVSRMGTLLVSEAVHSALRDLLGELGIPSEEHRTQWSPQPIYALPSDIAGRLAGAEAGTTVELAATRGTMAMHTTASVGQVTLAALGPGTVLGERFEILSELGAGGMGIVYKARDRELDELVALKMLKHDAFAGDADALDRLKDELKLARKISHPNVLRTFDFGDADGFPFISMEFVRGVTLKRLLDQSGRLPLSAGLHMARQLCRGLQAAHSQAVLHRDSKPENMIIEPTGNVKLMDFGIAQTIQRRRGETSSEGPIVGTPFYLAPEQLEGREPDVRADIYACGVVFFEIFTGQLPFPGGNLMQIIGRKLNEDPPAPKTLWLEMPGELDAIILTCLARDRESRFTDVATLLARLETLRA
ncbi:MAG: protein kinase, partial [Holophagales bacterium]|nr:protein kinase [Holophagales bacterium]